MIGRTLDGEVGRSQTLFPCADTSLAKSSGSQFRLDGVMTAFLGTDGIGAAGIFRPGLKGCCCVLAVRAADWVDRRK